MAVHDGIARLFNQDACSLYFGEPITIKEHMLQAAFLAIQANAAPNVVVSALLHDVGHLLHGEGQRCADVGVDAHHERLGADYLQPFFGPAVIQPIRMHVLAKRYLCAVNLGYYDGLSPASKTSLLLQGGPFNQEEAQRFWALPYAKDAVLVRLYDDQAKVVGQKVPGIHSYAALVNGLMKKAHLRTD